MDLTWARVQGQGKKTRMGEKILLGEGRKASSSSRPLLPGSIPALPTWLLHFNQPLKLSLSEARLNSPAPHRAFPLPGMLFSPLHFPPCPTSLAKRKKRSQIEADIVLQKAVPWKAVGRNFQGRWLNKRVRMGTEEGLGTQG